MSSVLEDQLIASVQSSIGSLLYDNAVFVAERLVAVNSSEVGEPHGHPEALQEFP